MQDIANAVGLQKASLYHHVKSKQEILAAILDEALDLLILDMEQVAASADPPEVKLRRAIRGYLGRLAADADLAGVLLLEHRRLESPHREAHVARRDRFEGLWRGLLRQGVEQGAFAPMDETVVAFALLGVQNWLITWYRPDGRLSTPDFADQFADLFLDGLRPRTAGSAS
jgi:AcrR family transcriptional regulator